MHILIAPNAFKNSLDAEEAAHAIGEGLMESRLKCTCEYFPIGDGGDGTAELIIKKCGGSLVAAAVPDPLGRMKNASFGLIDEGKTAVIEMADASGLRLLGKDELDPLHASSAGTGELIKLALDKNVRKVIIAMGGSATVDGGSGILTALGIRFLNKEGFPLGRLPEDLVNLAKIDRSGLDKRSFNAEMVVLCDVNNKLLGEEGAAAVFGPQKGASPEEVKKLESSLVRFADVALKETGTNMAAVEYGGTA